MIAAGAPTRVWSASLGGFDTHANELSTQNQLLGYLGAALASFLTKLARGPRAMDVTLVVYSEFGRRVAANASQGTDHGSAGPMLVVGPRVSGGIHGEHPSLTQLNRGDLYVTNDFRSIYAEMLEKNLQTPADAVIPDLHGMSSLIDPRAARTCDLTPVLGLATP